MTELQVSFPTYIGHRGVKFVAPENTIAGFRAAVDLGLRAIEIDVCLTKDHVPIILHDDSLDRTTTASGAIENYNWSELADIEAIGGREKQAVPARIPTFQECLDFCAAENVILNAELKPHWESAEQLVTALVPLLEKTNVQIAFSSFSIPALQMTRQLLPQLPRALLIDEEIEDWQAQAVSCGASSLHVSQKFSEKRVKEIIAAGYPVRIYTINDKETSDRFLSWGAESIITDDPDLVR